MKITKKLAWKNQKCNECSDSIYQSEEEENKVYFCQPDNASPFKIWKFCEKCFDKIFSEEVRKKVK